MLVTAVVHASDQGLSPTAIFAMVTALAGGGGMLGWARWWGERNKPQAETNAVIVGVYGDMLDDLRAELDRLRAAIRECEQHRSESNLALSRARADIARLLEERPPPAQTNYHKEP